jgi:hypothetical protein
MRRVASDRANHLISSIPPRGVALQFDLLARAGGAKMAISRTHDTAQELCRARQMDATTTHGCAVSA